MLFFKKYPTFLAIGDVFIDTFIELADANVHCNINNSDCTISMKWGDKIPYANEWPIVGVGNAGNAAVMGARLGLPSGIFATIGSDDDGEKIKKVYDREGVLTRYLTTDHSLPTNNAYVLLFNAERTILVKQFDYSYHIPSSLQNHAPSWIYLTSLNKGSVSFHQELAAWIRSHPETRLAFQPGTFQMELGTDTLKEIYAATHIFFCNKQEAQRILKTDSEDWATLHAGIRALGPKLVVITDGVNGLTASDETGAGYHLPMYPDPKPPIDRTGAGDACSSTIVAAMQLELPFLEALRWGPINSMSVVQYIGAQQGLLSREQLEHYLADAPAHYHLTPLFSL